MPREENYLRKGMSAEILSGLLSSMEDLDLSRRRSRQLALVSLYLARTLEAVDAETTNMTNEELAELLSEATREKTMTTPSTDTKERQQEDAARDIGSLPIPEISSEDLARRVLAQAAEARAAKATRVEEARKRHSERAPQTHPLIVARGLRRLAMIARESGDLADDEVYAAVHAIEKGLVAHQEA